MSNLVIVESPAKAKTINKYLGKDFLVDASMGHIRDLPQKELGIDIENKFKPTYEIIKGKEGKVKQLKDKANSADTIYLASDPDREGEAIAWHLNSILKGSCKKIYRVEFHEITEKAVKSAIKEPHQINLNLVNAQQARRILDRIVGYKVSPFLWDKVRGGLSAGRVQSVAVRIIIDREEEIKNFDPREYWTMIATLQPLGSSENFDSKLTYIVNDGKKEKIEVTNKKDSKKIMDEIKNKTFKVSSIVAKPKNKKPFAPFTTSILQQEAARKINFESAKTMKVAQELYEGISLANGKSMGLITYMRTDSTRISEDFQKETLQYIKNEYGDKYVPKTPQKYNVKGGAQDAHEAIRPTHLENKPEEVKQYLTADQYKLYKLVWDRFISSQMADAMYDTVDVEVSVSNYIFKTTGSTLRFNGFLAVYNEDKDEGNEDDEEKTIKIPVMKPGDFLRLIDLKDKQNFTKPPLPFTEATLIKELEKRGIGRPSTYASIISVIQKKDRAYVEKKGKKFISTDLGRTVTKVLIQAFPDIMDITFTSGMETSLDEISEGKKDYEKVLFDFYEQFKSCLSKANEGVDSEKVPFDKGVLTDIKCEKCGKPMYKRKGKYGEYLACSGYPDCKNIVPLEKKPVDKGVLTDIKCEKCGKPMYKRKGKYGEYLACSGYPDCKNMMSIKKSAAEETDKKCPKCGHSLVLRESKFGGKFYSCSNYPKCKYSAPFESDILDKKCPECGGTLQYKYYKDKKTGENKKFIGCSNYPKCKYSEFEQ